MPIRDRSQARLVASPEARAVTPESASRFISAAFVALELSVDCEVGSDI